MGRAERITRAIQEHDGQLFAKREGEVIHIFRKWKKYVPIWLDEASYILHARPDRHLIFSLTDNWTVHGSPVDWGIEPIIARLKAMDLWGRSDFMDEWFKERERIEQSKRRDFRNNVESFMYDFRDQFKKATKDINTANLEKIDRRKKHGFN